MSLLDNFFAKPGEDDKYASNMAFFQGLAKGDVPGAMLQAQQAAQAKKLGDLKTEELQMLLQQHKAAAAKSAAIQQGLPGLFRQPGMTGGEAVPQSFAGTDIPQFSKPVGAAPMQSTPGGFDAMGAVRLGMDPDLIAKYAGLQNLGRPEVARTIETIRNGRPVTLQFDKFGQPVGQGEEQWKAPLMQNLGNRTAAIDPVNLTERGSFAQGQSPDSAASNALGWANHSLSRQRLTMDQNAPKGQYDAERGVIVDTRTGNATPVTVGGKPLGMKGGEQKVTDAKDVIGLLDEVNKLLPKATGSYTGTAVDEGARLFGYATDGAKATAQLSALQGALIGKMPKMSGPQSDKDVQLYREMAGQVADRTLPVETRQAASATIRALNEKYAGVSGSTPPAKNPAMSFSDPGKESRYQAWKRSQVQ